MSFPQTRNGAFDIAARIENANLPERVLANFVDSFNVAAIRIGRWRLMEPAHEFY